MKQIKVGVGFGLFRLGMPYRPDHRAGRRAGRGMGAGFVLAVRPFAGAVAGTGCGRDAVLIASRTSRIKLGPSVFLLNLRHPLITAKAFATLDYLSTAAW